MTDFAVTVCAVFYRLPFVGDVFAIALGFYKVPFWKSSFYMFVGKGLRFLLWTLLFIKYGEAVMNYIF